MTLQQLKYYCAVYECRNITKAARKNFVTQPAVTAAIRELEKEYAVRLIDKDGKQTPMKGHPVFVAQHATATCCRGCLYKWHHISKDKDLTKEQVDYVVRVIMRWIKKEVIK